MEIAASRLIYTYDCWVTASTFVKVGKTDVEKCREVSDVLRHDCISAVFYKSCKS